MLRVKSSDGKNTYVPWETIRCVHEIEIVVPPSEDYDGPLQIKVEVVQYLRDEGTYPLTDWPDPIMGVVFIADLYKDLRIRDSLCHC